MYCTWCYFGYLHLYLLYIWETLHICVLMVWIHMHVHEYICFFTKYEYFMYFKFFSLPVFFSFFFSGFRSGSHFKLCWLDDRSGSDNIDWGKCQAHKVVFQAANPPCHFLSMKLTIQVLLIVSSWGSLFKVFSMWAR